MYEWSDEQTMDDLTPECIDSGHTHTHTLRVTLSYTHREYLIIHTNIDITQIQILPIVVIY